MRAAVVVYPGTNCDQDTLWALNKVGFQTESVWHQETSLPDGIDLVVLPGGFSYGDYLRSAAIAKFSPITKDVVKFAKRGGYVLGICNGFQILLETSLLPGAMNKNQNTKFISKFQHLKVQNTGNKFLSRCKKGDILNIPIAHGEGNYHIQRDGLDELKQHEQILLTYCDAKGNEENPNGSVSAIAGICNKQKNIFGLMPHPERAMEKVLGCDDGVKMLEGFIF